MANTLTLHMTTSQSVEVDWTDNSYLVTYMQLGFHIVMPLLSEYLYGTCRPFAGINLFYHDVRKLPDVNTSYVIWPKGWIIKPLDSGKWFWGFYSMKPQCKPQCAHEHAVIHKNTHTHAFTLTWLLRLVCRTQLDHQTYHQWVIIFRGASS